MISNSDVYVVDSDLPPMNPQQRWIVEMVETPRFGRVPKILNGRVNTTCTFHHKADIPCLYGYFFPLGMYHMLPYFIPSDRSTTNKFLSTFKEKIKDNRVNMPHTEDKTKEVLWFCSRKGVKEREFFVKELVKAGMKVDVFGKCGKAEPCKSKFNRKCVKQYARKYWFYLALENSKCEDYITEKPWNSLIWGAVPIVSGPPQHVYERSLPPNSFIHKDNFTSIREMVKYLKFLKNNSNEYLKYHTWRKTYDILWEHDLHYLQLCNICKQSDYPPSVAHKNFSEEWTVRNMCS